MFDYKLLEALAMVAREEGFEKAAEILCITQSAVSQRIRALEERQGQILITRETPPVPTEKGMELIKLYGQVLSLEENLQGVQHVRTTPVGINADSLATWFLPVMETVLSDREIYIELIVDDQDRTAELLKKGAVSGCISSSPSRLQGCSIHRLGQMNYYPMATGHFRNKWFPTGVTSGDLKKAPAVIFNRKDKLHSRYLRQYFSYREDDYPRFYIPSSEKFLELIASGRAYGIVPEIQWKHFPDRDKVVFLSNEKIEVPLYWHHWNIDTDTMRYLTGTLLRKCPEILNCD